MKDCCRPEPKPGTIKRMLNTLTAIVLVILALAGLLAAVAG